MELYNRYRAGQPNLLCCEGSQAQRGLRAGNMNSTHRMENITTICVFLPGYFSILSVRKKNTDYNGMNLFKKNSAHNLG